jgi:hypothetical protein
MLVGLLILTGADVLSRSTRERAEPLAVAGPSRGPGTTLHSFLFLTVPYHHSRCRGSGSGGTELAVSEQCER